MATATKPTQRPWSRNPDPTAWVGRWRWWLAAVGALTLFVGLAPVLVAHSPLLAWLVGLAVGVRGEVRVESASLGWFSPVELTGLELCDESGQPVVEVARLAGDKSLLGLLFDPTRLGRFQAEKPKLTLVFRDDGSNFEDVLADYGSSDAESNQPASVEVEITDGQVLIADPRTQRSWQLENLQLAFSMASDASRPIELRTSGLVADPQRPGRFDVWVTMGATAQQPDQVTLKTENLPLAMLAPLVARLAPGTRIDGWLSSALSCQGAELAKLEGAVVQGEAAVDGLRLTAPQLGTDQIALGYLQAVWRLAWQGRRLQVDRLTVESDLVQASAMGAMDFSTLGFSAAEEGRGIARQAVELHGRVDLARLAAMLPATLRIRQDTRVTSGQMQISLSSRPGPEGMTWQAHLDARHLTAENQGRRLAWPQPILVVLAAREDRQRLVVDHLRCESDFLTVEGSGTSEEFTASANLDLNRLVAQLSGLIDFGRLRLAGDGFARLHWKQPPGQDFQANGQWEVRNFHLALPDRPPWAEEWLSATFSASGRTDFSTHTRLDTASLEIRAGEDHLQARLTQPIADFAADATWPVAVRSSGELARLLPRLRPWLSLDDWHLAGRYDFAGELVAAAHSFHVRHGRLTVEQLRVQGAGWNVREPHVELVAEGTWDPGRQRWELKSGRLTSAALRAQTQGFVAAWPPTGPMELAGTVGCQGRLDGLQSWIDDPVPSPTWRIAGQLDGRAEFLPSPTGLEARIDCSVRDLVVLHASGHRFHEPQVRLVGRGTYQAEQQVFVVEQAELSSDTLGAAVAGQYAAQKPAEALQLDGKLEYDLERLSDLARAYLGEGIYVAGRGSSPLSYHGPLAWSAGQGSAGLGWQWARLYGFEVSPGELQATLAGGTLRVQPLDLAASEGRVRVASELRLSDGPMTLAVAPGRLADQVRINPRMCAHALQYIAPVLAGVVTAEGRFSIELDACRIPLATPDRSELSGRMTIHTVQVGPGPLVQELAVLLGRPYPAQLTRESVIPFRLVDGRVYHQNLELVFPDVTIRTHGSVGLDQSLAIMAEMPVPPKWIGDNVLGAALRKEILRLPIGGTLAKPAIDKPALDLLSQRFFRNTAQNVLQDTLNQHQDEIHRGLDKLNQGLDRLFGPPPEVK